MSKSNVKNPIPKDSKTVNDSMCIFNIKITLKEI